MTHHGGEPVEVLRRFDDPTHVLWRGQLHVVHDVLAHWAEIGEWWHATLARPVGAAVSGRAAPAAHLTLVQQALPTWGVTEDTEIRLLPSPRAADDGGSGTGGADGADGDRGDGEAGGGGVRTGDTPAASGAGGEPGSVLTGRLTRTATRIPGSGDVWRAYGHDLPSDAPPRRVSRDPDIEREIWRVRATAGRRGAASEFELCLNLATREWTLTHDGAHRRRLPRGG